MKYERDFFISFANLKIGLHNFEFKIDNKFFEFLGYKEFLNASIKVRVVLDKKSTFLELKFIAKGSITVPCDVSNEIYNAPIEATQKLVVKFDKYYNDENDEILILPFKVTKIDVKQYIYDMIILSVPLKKIHPQVLDGTLKSETLNYLEKNKNKNKKNKINPEWEKLKELLK